MGGDRRSLECSRGKPDGRIIGSSSIRSRRTRLISTRRDHGSHPMATIRIPSWRYLGCLIPATAALAFAGFIVYTIVVHDHHSRWYREIDYRILRLAEKRPENVSPDRWAFCIHWTWQLHGNYGAYETFDRAERSRFLEEFDRRLNGRVDLGTIDWIWDQYVEHSTGGRRYSRNYRPTDPERLCEISEDTKGPSDLPWWLDRLNKKRSAQDRSD